MSKNGRKRARMLDGAETKVLPRLLKLMMKHNLGKNEAPVAD